MTIASPAQIAPAIRPPANSGISMTYDGHIAVAAMGALFVFDRDLKRKDYLLFPGEHVENSIAIDEKRIYVVTSRCCQSTEALLFRLLNSSWAMTASGWVCTRIHCEMPR